VYSFWVIMVRLYFYYSHSYFKFNLNIKLNFASILIWVSKYLNNKFLKLDLSNQ
jgi:hypothetical protein